MTIILARQWCTAARRRPSASSSFAREDGALVEAGGAARCTARETSYVPEGLGTLVALLFVDPPPPPPRLDLRTTAPVAAHSACTRASTLAGSLIYADIVNGWTRPADTSVSLGLARVE